VVPYPAGGPTDAIARIIAEDLGQKLGQNVIVRNDAGASGSIGTRGVANAEPDGHTIVFGNNQTHGNNMFLLREPGYDALEDFTPLAGVGAFEHVYVVRNDLEAQDIQELIELAKADPEALNYGSTGIGSGSHLSFELFMERTDTEMTHIPFAGAAPLVTELVAGRIDVSNSTLPSVLAQINAGNIRAIAIASPERNPQLPDLPTLREQGVEDADAESWAAIFAPAGVPDEVAGKLSDTLLETLAEERVAEAISQLGFTLNVRAPEEFRPYHEQEMETWRVIIDTAGVEAQ
jgi:tripartite-type tricarboxylate transporter receptor subunit TctC